MITAPGAPLSGFAFPVSTAPSPSPSHHTPSDQATEAPSAILTVGRQAIPMASSSCTVANAEFIATACCSMRRADQMIGSATTAGLPAAEAASVRANSLVNMNDWYCSTASSSQLTPRASCSRRRASGASQPTACWAPAPRPAVPLPAVPPPAVLPAPLARAATVSLNAASLPVAALRPGQRGPPGPAPPRPPPECWFIIRRIWPHTCLASGATAKERCKQQANSYSLARQDYNVT